MSATAGTIRVLHVDDDPNLAELVATFLEREDDRIDVATATDPETGRALLVERDVDCVVSDYDMPESNGIEFLETVRERHPDLPFILYTGKGSEEVASEAISAGVTDYLQKETGTEQYAILANRIENAVAQHRAEREIERTREYFGTVLRHASDYVMIVDEDGIIDYVSPAVERVLGYTSEDLDDTDALDLVHPEDRSMAAAAFDTVIEEPSEEHTVEFRARHADGSWRWLEVRGRSLLDDPVVDGVLVNARDVTERRSSRHELRTLVDNLPGYVYRHRNEPGWPLEFVKGSAVDIAGYTAAELEDDVSLVEKTIHPEDREAVWTGVQEGLAESDRYDLTYRILTPDGETRWIRDQGQLIEDPTTGEELLDGFITDVTDRKQRERELARTERRYRAIFDDPNILVGLIDTDGTVRDINQTAMEYADTTHDAVVGKPFSETPWFEGSPDAREEVEACIEHARRGEYVGFETELTEPDGTPYVAAGVFRPVTDDDGEVVSVIVSARDVTERRSQERTLRRYRRMVDAMGEAACIYDADGRFEVVNERLAEFYGTTPTELVGVESEFAAEVRAAHDGDPFRAILDGERAELRGEIETTFPSQGDSVIEYRFTPLRAETGIEGLVGVIRDITERREREREIERAREEYAELINAMNDTVWVVGTDGTFRAVNDTAVSVIGYSRAELRTMSPHDIDAGLDDDKITALIEEMPADEIQVVETVHETKSGERIPVEISSSLVTYRGETAILSVGRDISERKARERQLEEFASVVSHDLRTPLATARGRLELAREECESESLDEVARAHDRMHELIEDLLSLAREGTPLGELEAVDLAPLLRSCWDGVETGAATLVVDIDRTIRADRTRLRQLLENLFRNSVEHGSTDDRRAPRAGDSVEHGSTDNRPRIDDIEASETLRSTDAEGSDLTVTVGSLDGGFYLEDDGSGIPLEQPADVFDAGTTTADEGTGVGLSVVRRIADAHGWTAEVTHGSEGGARFEFTGVEPVDR